MPQFSPAQLATASSSDTAAPNPLRSLQGEDTAANSSVIAAFDRASCTSCVGSARKEKRFYGVVERAVRGHPLSSSQKKRNRKLSSVRCRVEHPFAEITCRMRFHLRYRGLRKADWQFTMVSAAYNLKHFIGQLFPAQAQAVIWRG